MCGAIPPLPNVPSWRGAKLKHRDNINLTFFFKFYVIVTLLINNLVDTDDEILGRTNVSVGQLDK
jgi:hypothetical protein